MRLFVAFHCSAPDVAPAVQISMCTLQGPGHYCRVCLTERSWRALDRWVADWWHSGMPRVPSLEVHGLTSIWFMANCRKRATQVWRSKAMFRAELEPATCRVFGGRDNHYTTERASRVLHIIWTRIRIPKALAKRYSQLKPTRTKVTTSMELGIVWPPPWLELARE